MNTAVEPLRDVFFWATVATAAIVLEITVFISRRKRRRAVYAVSGILGVILFEFPRFLIPLLPQPEIIPNAPEIRWVGWALFVTGIAVMMASFTQLMAARKRGWPLQTTGVYGIVRHPMYLGDVLWALGLSMAFNSLYALALTPLWLFLRYSIALLEEEKLIEKYGEDYVKYMHKVRRRIVPCIL